MEVKGAGQAGLLAAGLLAAGFCVGYGYGAGRRRAEAPVATPTPPPSATPTAAPSPPLVKGMRLAPDGHLLAFTGVYDSSRRAARFVLDLRSNDFSVRESPRGWQDYISGWTADGKVMFEREKIPRPVEKATAGIYEERVRAGNGPGGGAIVRGEPSMLNDDDVPAEEKVTGGFLDPDGHLIVKTRREPKAVFALGNSGARLLLRAETQIYQSRAIREGGRTVYYIARDVPGDPSEAALYRIDGTTTRQIGPSWESPVWMFLREDARQLIVCTQPEDGVGWSWTLYDATPQGLRLHRTARIPKDVIVVYWSADGGTMLGGGGDDMWAINVATLTARRLPRRAGNPTWQSDDASWLPNSRAVLIAADGEIWRADITGQSPPQKIWTFPREYWQ